MQNANKNPEYQENFEISGIQYFIQHSKELQGYKALSAEHKIIIRIIFASAKIYLTSALCPLPSPLLLTLQAPLQVPC
jgi:hypothetical protein